MEHDGEQTIKDAYQEKETSSNWWVNLHSKLLSCGMKLHKWDAGKNRVSKKELKDKISLLKSLQLQPSNMDAIKTVETKKTLNRNKEPKESGTKG